ncbi:hypothetical protein NQ314_011178 [Rhamnusium bicolor]|uniref:Ciliogenesis-associated TTC17-interacting protein N-terminal domain-containing protein n=1 Tax=Rhamnusium bicolor TaxID=1586634 RepID=A0AAV8XLD9_9CUCU|nr:hypothetical protein NQ314_011178 [Rhamnusium bicolor]
MFEEIIPKSLEATIWTYLKDQEAVLEGDLHFEEISPEDEIKGILDELLFKVNKRIACRDRYDNLKQWHHQYALFDINDFVSDYCMDDELFEKLSFRETLLISALDPDVFCKEVEPKAVGGLCLDIQMAEGHQPEKRERPTDAQLDKEVLELLQKAKLMAVRSPSIEDSDIEQQLQERLKEYESFLKNEMKQNVKKYVIHLSSQFDANGYNAGSRITSWVDRYLHTLEEKRTEFVQQDDVLNEKSIYMALQNNKYYIKNASSIDNIEDRKYYSLAKMHDLVSEGANFVLMRYLAVMQYIGTFELSTIYINGDLCRNIYVRLECTGPKPGEVNGKTVDVCKIYRYIIEECGIEHHCVTVLTTNGRIVTQEWEGCDYILNMNPLQFIQSGAPSSYDRLVLPKTWEHDMQLMSKYLDCKTAAECQMKTYMADHPEVREMIADYVQNILMLKPVNIMSFTMDYFQSLYPCKMARLTYIEDVENEESGSELSD